MLIRKMSAPQILLIGDTIINHTYLARPAHYTAPYGVPTAFFNEELLEVVNTKPNRPLYSVSYQGIGYIASYLSQALTSGVFYVWTGVGDSPESTEIRETLARLCRPEFSDYLIDGKQSRVVIRILRDTSTERIHGQRGYRPQLRIDTRAHGHASLPKLSDPSYSRNFQDANLCLIRNLSPDFFAEKDFRGLPLRQTDHGAIAETALNLQLWLQSQNIPSVIDLRPIPPGFRVVDKRTVLCTTLGRLCDYWALHGSDIEAKKLLENVITEPEKIIEKSFWRFHPARAIVCFAENAGTFLCERRGADPTAATLSKISITWPQGGSDDSGAVTSGEAFVSALIAQMIKDGGADLSSATSQAHAAMMLALHRPAPRMAEPVTPGELAGAAVPTIHEVSRPVNDHLDRLGIVCKTIEEKKLNLMTVQGLISPEGGTLAKALQDLRQELEKWAPQKGKDLLVIFGESRAGKEYAIGRLLNELKYQYLAPINMHQFLTETAHIINELIKDDNHKRVLIIDEIQPGDAARPLLNLMAEKTFKSYVIPGKAMDFEMHKVILMSSIPEDQLLDDLRGRLCGQVTIPPLRDRWQDIPFMLRVSIEKAVPKLKAQKTYKLRVSTRCLDGLLHYDYAPRPATKEPGVDQRNFRALEDILGAAYKNAEKAGRGLSSSEIVTLLFEDLSPTVRSCAALTPRSVDDRFVAFSTTYSIGQFPELET